MMRSHEKLVKATKNMRIGNHQVVIKGTKRDFIYFYTVICAVDDEAKTFHCDIPQELASLALRCKSDDEAKQLGIEWATRQVKDLYEHGFNNVHFYTVSAVDSVHEVIKRLL